MDSELKAKWLKALRSGRYKQTSEQLKDGFGGFCCLGVLCQIQKPEWDDRPLAGLVPKQCKPGSDDEGYGPKDLMGGLNLRSRKKLAKMNDDGKSFKEIASFIEKNY